MGFNPRTHVGCDPSPLLLKSDLLAFQSTHPRRVRRIVRVKRRQLLRFNPRTHVGCDEKVKLKIFIEYVSIHAPT